MSWAAGRRTTVSEDRAYSLPGLFGIRMPLIYGEGTANAFLRLQLELIKQTDDESIFAWGGYSLSGRLFAPSPNEFKGYGDFHNVQFDGERQEMLMSNKGLIMSPLLYQCHEDAMSNQNRFLIPLNHGTEDQQNLIALLVESRGSGFVRVENHRMIMCSPHDEVWTAKYKLLGRRRIFLRNEPVSSWSPFDRKSYLILFSPSKEMMLQSVNQQSGIRALKSARNTKLRLLPAGGETHSYLVEESCFMTAGHFALGEFTAPYHNGPIQFAVAVRRGTGSLSLEAWFFDTVNENLDRIQYLRDNPPPPSERCDFLRLRRSDRPIFDIRLQARGFLESWKDQKIAWDDLAPASSSSGTYVVQIYGPFRP